MHKILTKHVSIKLIQHHKYSTAHMPVRKSNRIPAFRRIRVRSLTDCVTQVLALPNATYIIGVYLYRMSVSVERNKGTLCR